MNQQVTLVKDAFKTPDVKPLVARMVNNGSITDPDCAKGKLLNCAAHLFKTKGFTRTTVRDIARDVGILSGSIFHHFPNKESILCGAIQEALLIATEKMKTSLELASTPKERLLALIQCELEAIHGLTGEGFSLMVNEWRSLSSESQAELLTLKDEYEKLWMDILIEAREVNLIAVESFLVRRFLIGALSYTYNWFNFDCGMTLENLATDTFKMITQDSLSNINGAQRQ